MSPSSVGDADRCRDVSIDRAEAAVDGGEQGIAVGVLVEHIGPVGACRLRRLDQQVCPLFVVGCVREVEAFGEPGAAERQVPLRVRRDGVQGHAEHVRRQRVDPVRRGDDEVGLVEPPGPELDEAVPERAEVEGVTATQLDGRQGQRDTRSADPCAAAGDLFGDHVEGCPALVVEHVHRGEQQGARREAVGGVAPRRSEHRLERE